MKNVYVLPTYKPSRLVKLTLGYNLHQIPFMDTDNNIGCNRHIYITDESEINEGNPILEMDTNTINIAGNDYIKNESDLKIILTTDPDLIKDGVQAIDDTFLKWFIKNSSCEKVEIKFETLWLNQKLGGTWQPFPDEKATKKKINYKITTPKEEPKQKTIEVGHPESLDFKAGVKYEKDRILQFLHFEIIQRRPYSASKMCEEIIDFINKS